MKLGYQVAIGLAVGFVGVLVFLKPSQAAPSTPKPIGPVAPGATFVANLANVLGVGWPDLRRDGVCLRAERVYPVLDRLQVQAVDRLGRTVLVPDWAVVGAAAPCALS